MAVSQAPPRHPLPVNSQAKPPRRPRLDGIEDVDPIAVAAYVEQGQHLAGRAL